MLEEFPSGIVSVVSDSYDVYKLIGEKFGGKYKEQILNRDGKFVIRPDSGDPVETTLKILDLLGKPLFNRSNAMLHYFIKLRFNTKLSCYKPN